MPGSKMPPADRRAIAEQTTREWVFRYTCRCDTLWVQADAMVKSLADPSSRMVLSTVFSEQEFTDEKFRQFNWQLENFYQKVEELAGGQGWFRPATLPVHVVEFMGLLYAMQEDLLHLNRRLAAMPGHSMCQFTIAPIIPEIHQILLDHPAIYDRWLAHATHNDATPTQEPAHD